MEFGVVNVEREMGLLDAISTAGILFTAIAVVFAVRTYRQSLKTRRAEFSLAIWQAFAEPGVRSLYNEIEWQKFDFPFNQKEGWYFAYPTEELELQKLLSLFDEIALLIVNGVLSREDEEKWMHHGALIFHNEGVVRYLFAMDEVHQALRSDLETNAIRFAYRDARKLFNGDSLEAAGKVGMQVAVDD